MSWFDVPVADLDRADQFYASALNVQVNRQQLGVILSHSPGRHLAHRVANSIGSHGFILDSEGNRLALHSSVDG